MYSVFVANQGFDVYTNIVYNRETYDTILPHQMMLINFCTELYFLKTRYKLLTCTSSIQMPSVKKMNEQGVNEEKGLQVYNNINVLSGPDQDIKTGQTWHITWYSDWRAAGQQEMTFHRIHKSLRTLPQQAAIAALEAREQADDEGLHDDVAKARALAAYDAVWAKAGEPAIKYMNSNLMDQRTEAGVRSIKPAASRAFGARSRAFGARRSSTDDDDVSAGGGNKRRKKTKGKKTKGKKTKKQTSK
jgi:hypothetical protein